MSKLQCEMCESQWEEETADCTKEEIQDEKDTIKADRRCLGCIDEWGYDGWPDR